MLKQELYYTKTFYKNYIVKDDIKKTAEQLVELLRNNQNSKRLYNRYYSCLFVKTASAFTSIFTNFGFTDEDSIAIIEDGIRESIINWDADLSKFVTFAYSNIKRKCVSLSKVKKYHSTPITDEYTYNSISYSDKENYLLETINTNSKLTDTHKKIIGYLMDGYLLKDICGFVGLSFPTLKVRISEIKAIL